MSQQIFTGYAIVLRLSEGLQLQEGQDLGENSDMYRIYQLNAKLDRISIHVMIFGQFGGVAK